jgi:hypothetical protein
VLYFDFQTDAFCFYCLQFVLNTSEAFTKPWYEFKEVYSSSNSGFSQDPSSPHPNGEHPGDIRENGEKVGIGSIKSERPPSRSGSSSSRSTPSLKSKDVRSWHLSAGPSSSQKSYAGLWFLFKYQQYFSLQLIL